jgi:hypothetical protein
VPQALPVGLHKQVRRKHLARGDDCFLQRDLITILFLDLCLYDRVGKVEIRDFLESPDTNAESPIES